MTVLIDVLDTRRSSSSGKSRLKTPADSRDLFSQDDETGKESADNKYSYDHLYLADQDSIIDKRNVEAIRLCNSLMDFILTDATAQVVHEFETHWQLLTDADEQRTHGKQGNPNADGDSYAGCARESSSGAAAASCASVFRSDVRRRVSDGEDSMRCDGQGGSGGGMRGGEKRARLGATAASPSALLAHLRRFFPWASKADTSAIEGRELLDCASRQMEEGGVTSENPCEPLNPCDLSAKDKTHRADRIEKVTQKTVTGCIRSMSGITELCVEPHTIHTKVKQHRYNIYIIYTVYNIHLLHIVCHVVYFIVYIIWSRRHFSLQYISSELRANQTLLLILILRRHMQDNDLPRIVKILLHLLQRRDLELKTAATSFLIRLYAQVERERDCERERERQRERERARASERERDAAR